MEERKAKKAFFSTPKVLIIMLSSSYNVISLPLSTVCVNVLKEHYGNPITRLKYTFRSDYCVPAYSR